MTNLLSISDINTTINHEPRILDLRLAEALGFEKPRDIRPLIERHKAALERLGQVCRTVRQTSAKGGRPTTETHLNKKQAIYIASKSETANAVDLVIHVIEVFDSATKCQLKPPAKPRGGQREIEATHAPAATITGYVTQPVPFDDGFLSQLAHVFYLANQRLVKCQALTLHEVVEGVIADIAALKNGRPASGKAMHGIDAAGNRLTLVPRYAASQHIAMRA